MRKIIAVFAALLLALSGCGGPEAPPPESPVSPASPASQETPPEVLDPSPADPEEDALVREIILAYGGELMPQKDGSSRLVRKVSSLFDMPYSWHRPEEIPANYYYIWFLSTVSAEKDQYASPALGEQGIDSPFFPQEVYEEEIRTYFDVPTEFLRLGREYDPKLEGYWSAGEHLLTGRKGIDYTYTREGPILTIDLEVDHPEDSPLARRFTLTVRLEEDGGWRYLGCQCQPNRVPDDYPTREGADVLPLTEEQWELLDQAEQLVQIFRYSIDSMENYYGTVDYSNPIQIDGMDGWCLYTGDRYQSFADLRGQMCQVLTEDFFDRLNQHGPFIDYQGRLYVRLGSRGGYSPYLGRDRYSARAEGDQILLTRYAYYRASDDNDQPAQVRAMPILLKRTAEGWRVDYLDLPY